MKEIAFILLIHMALSFSIGGEIINGKIDGLMVDRDHGSGGTLFIEMNQDQSGPPSCQIHDEWKFTLDLSQSHAKEWLSIILTAYSTDQSIDVYGEDSCNEYYKVESLNRIKLR